MGGGCPPCKEGGIHDQTVFVGSEERSALKSGILLETTGVNKWIKSSISNLMKSPDHRPWLSRETKLPNTCWQQSRREPGQPLNTAAKPWANQGPLFRPSCPQTQEVLGSVLIPGSLGCSSHQSRVHNPEGSKAGRQQIWSFRREFRREDFVLFGELVDGILWEVALKGKSLRELTDLQRNLLLTSIAHPYTEEEKKKSRLSGEWLG